MKKAYHFLFYKLMQLFSGSNIGGYEDGLLGATFVMNILILSIIIAINNFIESIMGKEFLFEISFFNIPLILIVAIIVYLFITFSLLQKKKWSTYLEEFEAYPSKKSKMFSNYVVIAIVIIVILLILSFVVWVQRYKSGLIQTY